MLVNLDFASFTLTYPSFTPTFPSFTHAFPSFTHFPFICCHSTEYHTQAGSLSLCEVLLHQRVKGWTE